MQMKLVISMLVVAASINQL